MQYTRVYVNSTGEVIHVATSGIPITFDPVIDEATASVYEFVFDAVPDRFVRARELLGVLDTVQGERLALRPAATQLIANFRNEARRR